MSGVSWPVEAEQVVGLPPHSGDDLAGGFFLCKGGGLPGPVVDSIQLDGLRGMGRFVLAGQAASPLAEQVPLGG